MADSKQVALVTGASRGIGCAIAKQLADDGFFVIGTATSERGTRSIAECLGSNGDARVLNVTNPEMITELVSDISKHHGAPHVLVNNAAITNDNIAMRMKLEEWQAVIDTNLTSIYHMSKACMRGMMKARSGRIINITSVVGVTGNAGQTNYAAAKAGMIGYTKSLALEIASRNITVNAIAPGFIATDMTKQLSDEQREALLGMIPLHAMGKPEDIAAAVSFLASNHAAYITGQTLHVNGGMFMN